jgi:hypothetical protein
MTVAAIMKKTYHLIPQSLIHIFALPVNTLALKFLFIACKGGGRL